MEPLVRTRGRQATAGPLQGLRGHRPNGVQQRPLFTGQWGIELFEGQEGEPASGTALGNQGLQTLNGFPEHLDRRRVQPVKIQRRAPRHPMATKTQHESDDELQHVVIIQVVGSCYNAVMRRAPILVILLISTTLACAEDDGSPVRMRVNVPVLDVRREPQPATPSLDHDPLQETQLLYGELVLVHEQQGNWARIEAVEQPEWSHAQRWEGYPGWVEADKLVPDDPAWVPNLIVTDALAIVHSRPHEDQTALMKLSLGTQVAETGQGAPLEWWQIRLLDGRDGWVYRPQAKRVADLTQLGPDERRRRIVEAGQRLVGTSYYWGGRSARMHGYRRPPNTAVDCSGFTNLCYRTAGLSIPRDAHEQSLKATAIQPDQLKPGDLIFLADRENAEAITHVMLYAGEGQVLEAPGTGGRVRVISLNERLAQDDAQGRRTAYGTYLP